MKDKRPSDKRLFPGLEPPEPPLELRDRVLRHARSALEEQPEPDRWSQIWENRIARLAWAASVTALIAGHIAITPTQRKPVSTRTPTMSMTLAARHGSTELSEIVRLPKLRFDAQSLGSHLRELTLESHGNTENPDPIDKEERGS